VTRGVFIAVEGADGSGKSTQARRLAAAYSVFIVVYRPQVKGRARPGDLDNIFPGGTSRGGLQVEACFLGMVTSRTGRRRANR
jgi:hypothetical protein